MGFGLGWVGLGDVGDVRGLRGLHRTHSTVNGMGWDAFGNSMLVLIRRERARCDWTLMMHGWMHG